MNAIAEHPVVAALSRHGYLSNEEYLFVFSKVPRLCVDLVIVPSPGNRVLVGQRTHAPYQGLWALPGGRVLHGESISQAIMRIAQSEIGVSAKSFKSIGFSEYLEEIAMVNTHSVAMTFLVDVEGESVPTPSFSRLSTNRHVDYAWIVPQHLNIIESFLST